jgi:SSS family solute:Na+ symporter
VKDTEFPWTGILFGAPILGIWYWCTDQMIVQRTLATQKVSDARRASIFAGFLKILPVFILVLPGLVGRILYPELIANNKSDMMYATMVNNLLPAGIKGLVIAALLAALMSSLSSVFNSSSTLVVMDFYKKWRPNASEKSLVRAGQIATVLLVVVGLLWIPFIGVMSKQLFVYLQSVQAYISPPIAAVFLGGLFWKRLNGRGAFASLICGFVLGAARFIAEIAMKAHWITWKPLVFYASINFLHFAIFLFVVSIAVLVIVSLATAPPLPQQVNIFPAKEEAKLSESSKTFALDLMLSILLAIIVLALWVLFSPLIW